MQANFPTVSDWNGAIGLGHVASLDLATWIPVAPALVPGRWGGSIGGVGEPRPSGPWALDPCPGSSRSIYDVVCL